MELSKKEIIVNSWKIMKSHLPLMIAIVLFIITLNIILSIVQEKMLGAATYQSIIFVMAAYLFLAGLNLGMLRICLNMINNVDVDFSLLFSSFHMLAPYAVATIFYLASILLAASPGLFLFIISASVDLENLSMATESVPAILSTLLMIIPAIYLSVRLQFYEYFLIDEECGILESIKKSADISKGYVLELFILGAILALIVLVSIVPLGLGLILSLPLSTVATRYVYLKLKKNH
jgi:uncharacterized membrane protein